MGKKGKRNAKIARVYQAAFEAAKQDYASKEFRLSFRELLSTIDVKTLAVDNIVIMGLGLRYPIASTGNDQVIAETRQSMHQLAFILDVAEYLETETGICIKIYAQDPFFDEPETKFLKNNNVYVIPCDGSHISDWNEAPPSVKQPVEDYLTSKSLIFDCFCPLDTMTQVYANSDPAMVIGTNLEASLQTAVYLLFIGDQERDAQDDWPREWKRWFHNRIHVAKEFQHSHKHYLLNRCKGMVDWVQIPNVEGQILSFNKATLYLRNEDAEKLVGWRGGRAASVQYTNVEELLRYAQLGAPLHGSCELCAPIVAEYRALAQFKDMVNVAIDTELG
jgi:hypothetical protein